jgi:hypothetical protein
MLKEPLIDSTKKEHNPENDGSRSKFRKTPYAAM